MTISDKKFVEGSYDLYVGGEDGTPEEIMESATKAEPLKFTYGIGMMLEKFEEKLKGKSVGDKFDFTISSDEAYGDYDDSRVMELDKAIFEVDGKVDEEGFMSSFI